MLDNFHTHKIPLSDKLQLEDQLDSEDSNKLLKSVDYFYSFAFSNCCQVRNYENSEESKIKNSVFHITTSEIQSITKV